MSVQMIGQTKCGQLLLINDWSAILLCLPCIIFHEYMCGFLLFTEFWCFAFGFLLQDLAVVTKFSCHIEKIISF